MKHPLPDMMGNSIAKIREMADANTIIGEPITTPEGVMIIPVSKVKYGFAGGGSDFAAKGYPANKENPFGGGTGASVSITPVAFLIVKGESVRLMPIAEPASNSLERLIEMLPELIDQVSGFISQKKAEKAEETEA